MSNPCTPRKNEDGNVSSYSATVKSPRKPDNFSAILNHWHSILPSKFPSSHQNLSSNKKAARKEFLSLDLSKLLPVRSSPTCSSPGSSKSNLSRKSSASSIQSLDADNQRSFTEDSSHSKMNKSSTISCPSNASVPSLSIRSPRAFLENSKEQALKEWQEWQQLEFERIKNELLKEKARRLRKANKKLDRND
jgi:hypothetical protein